ncbi:sensor histidine kinase [Spirosoma montaniterrae]|uniref:histidine kinase n=1 Tax=Spirosoma montaniterrae TaxID=1178516 RepID=A0A1P9X203_9BACT|nr:sensor histidine kinase [Spirosoma montaniterrae]AQG81662.1 hypothetical protein AWR27_21540 [Spirosoma montaniterrae]
MHRLALIGIFVLVVSAIKGQPILRLDSAFRLAEQLPLFQERHPIRPQLSTHQPIQIADWQAVSGVHYGNTTTRGRAFFRCQSTTNRTVWLELTSHFLDTVWVTLVRPDTSLRFRPVAYTDLAAAPSPDWPNLPVRHRYFVLALPLLENQPTTVFIEGCVPPGDYLKFGVRVWEPSQFLSYQQQDTWTWAFFVGIFLMAVFIGLLNFLIDAQRIFLYYAVYISCLTIYSLLNDGWGVMLPPSLHWLDDPYALGHFLNSGLCCFILFSRRFLSLPRLTARQWDNPVWLLVGLAVLIEAVRHRQAVGNGWGLGYRVGIVGVMGYAVLFARYIAQTLRQNAHRPTALFLLSAVGSMLLFYAVNFLLNASGQPSPLPDMLLFRLAFTVELFVITLGWLYRQRFIRHSQLLLERSNRQQAESLQVAQEQLIHAQETERRRLAADLHDDIGTSLLALRGKMPNQPDAEQLLNKIIRDVRTVSHNLLPVELHDLGLPDAVAEVAHRLETASGIRFLFVCSGQRVVLPSSAELILYRAVQELLHNIVKHSRATDATVQLVYHDTYLNITIEDNGRGFTDRTVNNQRGIGLQNVDSRVKSLTGEVAIDTGPAGTTVRIDVPYLLDPNDRHAQNPHTAG